MPLIDLNNTQKRLGSNKLLINFVNNLFYHKRDYIHDGKRN
ncbi:MAG: hypothetical protein JWM09_1309 [Francisellaceae bacterium]|nr:hypothetical protein [Francisellaceae bacterium]